MTFKLSDADIEADFDEFMAAQWAAFEEPMQPLFRLFCPSNNGDREASLKASTARMLKDYREDPYSRLLKVEDTSTGRIAGAAWYKIYKENPFARPEEETVADWYPDDSSRDFVSQAIRQMERPRHEKGTRPQVFLYIILTHPDYRRKGIGAMLVQWGIDMAKELGVEFWLDASPVGKPLYEKMGFELVERVPLVPKTEVPDEVWNTTAQKFKDVVVWTMWRPKEDRVRPDQKVRPWEA
ncbi:acyl-CoA N-acyltransferase [Bimuria novae-zelandiae CBS 107.79]|uniref:Acyl-CoA N-acyltransferase n=1 Tax=Bimuria novae-zelandiae CBS 107.79 TaxID=1447943 RepID=A0A6A5VIH8_9PLEO|nr:acyl-CoA N-acyltransferase [Bimuria novae-zelandiae CBS 107.79]